MKVLLAASEVTPFAKTGGLADVCGSLPRALARLGVDVAVVMPYYAKVRARKDPVEVVHPWVSCPFGRGNRPFRLLRGGLPGEPHVPVYFVENPGMFEVTDDLYAIGSYGEADLRFIYFCRAVLKVGHATGFHPDVLHTNDWQTALVGPLLRTVHRHDPALERTAVVHTIHNLAYQGVFSPEDMRAAGVPDYLLVEGRLLERTAANLMAAGIRFADTVTTVSRSYAEEILSPLFGENLDPVLAWRRDLLRGVVNGIDTNTWNPATDPSLPATYGPGDLSGKRVCRRQLLSSCGLEPTGGPVFGVVSRLVEQKGLNLVLEVMDALVPREPDIRLVVLGSGHRHLEQAFHGLARAHPRHVHVRIGFDVPFSSLVEAGSDWFLMPSRFEPCGLNQLISMRYGTPPVARAVGGLKDTITDATDENLRAGRATGILFEEFSSGALAGAVDRALDIQRSRPRDYYAMQQAGMAADWSWDRSAREYTDIYDGALERAQEPVHLEPLLKDLPPHPLEVELPPLVEIPSRYGRRALYLTPRDPRTLFARWEIPEDTLEAAIRDLGRLERLESHCELVLRDEADGSLIRRPVEDSGWTWIREVLPGHSYSAAVRLHAPGRDPRPLLEHAPVELPDDVWPDEG